jgi:uncharacterized HAD superfamily protein
MHDLDDTHNQMVLKLLEWHNTLYGTTFTFNDVVSYHLWHLWGGDRHASIKKFELFYNSDYFDNIEIMSGSKYALEQLKEHTHYIVTSRPSTLKDKTESWVNKHFPSKFKDIIITNAFADGETSLKKSEVCDNIGADIVVEDSLDNAIDCDNGKRLILLFDKPWNQSDTLPKTIIRVKDWEDAVMHIRDFEKK